MHTGFILGALRIEEAEDHLVDFREGLLAAEGERIGREEPLAVALSLVQEIAIPVDRELLDLEAGGAEHVAHRTRFFWIPVERRRAPAATDKTEFDRLVHHTCSLEELLALRQVVLIEGGRGCVELALLQRPLAQRSLDEQTVVGLAVEDRL